MYQSPESKFRKQKKFCWNGNIYLQVHLFTGIQAATLVALWIIKSTSASLIFPLMVSTLSSLFLFVYTNSSNIYPVIMSDNRLQFQINLSLLKRDHIVQVLAMVGFRKAMDYCPSLFSQRDLFYLDRLAIFNSCWNFGNWLKLKKNLDCSLMPEKRKKNKSKRTGAGSNEVGWKLRIWKLMFVLQMYPDKGNLLYSR